MKLRQLRESKKAMFAFLLISLLLCINAALGSTLDVSVSYEGIPVPQAAVYIDDNPNPIGYTLQDGTLKNINIGSGFHIVRASGQDSYGNQRSGTGSFTVQLDAYAFLNIILT